MDLIDALNGLWTTILNVTSVFVMPDWGWLISILPVLIFVGVVGPFITFTMLGSMVYLARKPRVKVTFEEGPRVAELDAGRLPVFPKGLPYCRRDSLIYPSGTTRCETCKEELAVICPMCDLGRAAVVDTCSNCGLVLKVMPRAVAVRSSAGPKPGGAAVA